MRDGRFVAEPQPWTNDWKRSIDAATPALSLHHVALQWLKDDREIRKQQEASGERKKTRGARAGVCVVLRFILLNVDRIAGRTHRLRDVLQEVSYTRAVPVRWSLSPFRYDYSH